MSPLPIKRRFKRGTGRGTHGRVELDESVGDELDEVLEADERDVGADLQAPLQQQHVAVPIATAVSSCLSFLAFDRPSAEAHLRAMSGQGPFSFWQSTGTSLPRKEIFLSGYIPNGSS